MFGKIRLLLSFLWCFGFREYRRIMDAAELHMAQRRAGSLYGYIEPVYRVMRWWELRRALNICWDYDCIVTYRVEHGIKVDAKALGQWSKDHGNIGRWTMSWLELMEPRVDDEEVV